MMWDVVGRQLPAAPDGQIRNQCVRPAEWRPAFTCLHGYILSGGGDTWLMFQNQYHFQGGLQKFLTIWK